MTDKKYGGAGRFASTGGWTLAQGDPMDHYSMHRFMVLTSEQQVLVEKKFPKAFIAPVAAIPFTFPIAITAWRCLGFRIDGLAGVSGMYKAALAVNSYWFPDTYITIAKYLKSQGKDWSAAVPKGNTGL